jgi:hypothetical protein
LCAKARPFESVFYRWARSIEASACLLWNYWYDTLASVEALATVIVIVLVAAGAITLAESRRR